MSFVLPKIPEPLPLARKPSTNINPSRYWLIASTLNQRPAASARNSSPFSLAFVLTTFTITMNMMIQRINVPLNSCQAMGGLMASGTESKAVRQKSKTRFTSDGRVVRLPSNESWVGMKKPRVASATIRAIEAVSGDG